MVTRLFIIPQNLPYSHIEEVAQEHHRRLCAEWYRHAPDDPTPDDLSRFLLGGDGAVIPVCTSVNALYVRPLSGAAAELVAHLPARAWEVFAELLEEAVIRFCRARDGPPRNYVKPMYFDRPVRVSHRYYGAFVGPGGSRIREATRGRGRLLWSTTRGRALLGEFELWVSKHNLDSIKDQIYATYRDVID